MKTSPSVPRFVTFALALHLGCSARDDAVEEIAACVVDAATGTDATTGYAVVCTGPIPVLAPPGTDDRALTETHARVMQMLARAPRVERALVDQGARVVILAEHMLLQDLPGHEALWDSFEQGNQTRHWQGVRGLGGLPGSPLTVVPEENVLGFANDVMDSGYDLVAHELGHTVHLVAMARLDPAFDGALTAAFDAAIGAKKWQGTYASTNATEYWADGTAIFFEVAGAYPNGVRTRDDLRSYDPALSALLESVWGDVERLRPPIEPNGSISGAPCSDATVGATVLLDSERGGEAAIGGVVTLPIETMPAGEIQLRVQGHGKDGVAFRLETTMRLDQPSRTIPYAVSNLSEGAYLVSFRAQIGPVNFLSGTVGGHLALSSTPTHGATIFVTTDDRCGIELLPRSY